MADARRFKLNVTTPEGLVTDRFGNRREADKAFTAAKRGTRIGTIELFDTHEIGGLLRCHKASIKDFERAESQT